MKVEFWKMKQYYEQCIMHIRKSHGCLLANDKNTEIQIYFKQTNKNQKTELSVPDANFVSWHILLFSHHKIIRQLSPYFNKSPLKENSSNK